MKEKTESATFMAICVLIFLLTSAPVFCGYVMQGGDAVMWLDRIREVKQGLEAGGMVWFPSRRLIEVYGRGAAAFDSGIWLFPVIGMQLLGMEEQLAYCCFIGLIGVGTMLAAGWMMKAFSEKSDVVLFGILFYMSCPYHIYICYDRADIGQALCWALVPMFTGGMVRLCKFRGKSVSAWFISVLAYAGIWYADARWGVIVGGCMVLYVLIWERWIWGFLPVAAGGILAIPVILYLAEYLLMGNMQDWNLPLDSIMRNGYTIGTFLTSWVYRPDMPGLGMGLMGGLLLAAWLYWRGCPGRMGRSVKGLLFMAGILAVVSLKYFSWDYVQRLGMPFFRFVGLLETSGIFWGYANMLLVIPAAWAAGELRKKPGYLWRWILPVILLSASLAGALYICNSLTYLRPPVGQDVVSTVVY